MSREQEIAAILYADATLRGLLTGGIYVNGGIWDEDEEEYVNDVGWEGVTRETTPAAFDSDGFLRPCALVRQRARVTTGEVIDYDAQIESARQVVVVWYYDDRLYTVIDQATARTRVLLFGEQLEDSFELRPGQLNDRLRDPGPLNGAAMATQDWQIVSIVE